MAAVAYPIPHDRRVGAGGRPDLRLVHGGWAGQSRSVYRRRRLVALVLLVAVVAGVWLAARAVGSLGGEPLVAPEPALAATRTYVVRPGDTLWDIARRVDPSGDVRRSVQRLAAANGGTAVRAGQHLVLP